MSDSGPQDDGDDAELPMTLVSVLGSYWIYEGDDLLEDLLFGTGSYPFRVRCAFFKDNFELRRFFSGDFTVGTAWRINPEIIERLRREDLLVEVYPYGR